jgi:hypothetical protein
MPIRHDASDACAKRPRKVRSAAGASVNGPRTRATVAQVFLDGTASNPHVASRARAAA